MYNRKYTPERISSLAPDEVFVFGSNLGGYHGGGAARIAYEHFGAVWGRGVGLRGQSYAIPTMQGGVETIRPYVDDFIKFARERQDLVFYVTRIGCGIAGFKDEQIAPLFKDAIDLENIILPESFVKLIETKPRIPNAIKDMLYGQTRTMVDILKAMDKIEPIRDIEQAKRRLDDFIRANLRSGDQMGFIAQRTIWSLLSLQGDKSFDLDRLEKEMYAFHEDERGFGSFWDEMLKVYYKYCVAKLIRYISVMNTFRRYKDSNEVYDDIQTVDNDHCGENKDDYFFSFDKQVVWMLRDGLDRNREEIFRDGHLDSEALEKVFFKNHQELLDSLGVERMIEEHYGNVGCHSEIQRPSGRLVGPVYKLNVDNQFEVSCHGLSRFLRGRTAFEVGKAVSILEHDSRYEKIGESYNRYFVPVDDFSLPVVSTIYGIMEFDTEANERSFIADLKRRYDPGR